MNCYTINSNDFEKTFKKLGCENSGAKIIAKKANTICLFIKDLHTGAANILKQDALSIGADLAVPRGTILNTTPNVDCILVGNTKHFEILAKKELAQPFGLKDLAKQIKSFIKPKKVKAKIMGVINANDDSFYDKSRFCGKDAIVKIEQMIQDGAKIIDIGGVSSRPGSLVVSSSEELTRVKDICDLIKEKELYKQVDFSIDSYTPSVIEYALNCGFSIVNDITGLFDNKVCEVVAKYNATVVIMHMQGTPQTMQDSPSYDNILLEVDTFFEQRIKKAKDYGIKKIILDVGIGFGKTLEHNLTLLRNMDTYLHFGYPILLGASRKSMIEHIVGTIASEDRLPGTLAIHLEGLNHGASIIRCHDVKEHKQAIMLQEAITLYENQD
jgi:dihydropteroate synthase